MRVLITGAASYVGSVLVPDLLATGYEVVAFGLFKYLPEDVLPNTHPRLNIVKGDLRDSSAVERAVGRIDAVIHLACVANDDAWAVDPAMGRAVNYEAFRPLVRAAKEAGVKRFIYASSSSVYGRKTKPEVTEDEPLEPLTDYSRYKGLCEGVLAEEGQYGRLKAYGEQVLAEEAAPGFCTTSVRPGTICGWAPGLRLDVIVNMFVAQAMTNGVITVWGGQQSRALLDIRDMSRCYRAILEAPADRVDRKVWNVAAGNLKALTIAFTVSEETGATIDVSPMPPNDQRSYSISSAAIERDLGFRPIYTVREAIKGLANAFRRGMVPDAMTSSRYYRLRRMKELIASGEL